MQKIVEKKKHGYAVQFLKPMLSGKMAQKLKAA
jgi:hypothetical protein